MSNIIHVGFPKAGSSFLQKYLFPELSKFNVIDYKFGKAYSNYVITSGMFFDVDYAKSLLPNQNGNILLSNELLIGNPISGKGINDQHIPLKLKASGFEKVVISKRKNKEKWVLSLYNEYLKLGGKLSFKDFIANPEKFDTEYTLYHEKMILHQNQYIEYFKEVFGVNNVLVIQIEDVFDDINRFNESVSDFFSEEIKLELQNLNRTNESLPSHFEPIIRFFNNFSSSRIAPSSTFRFFTTQRVLRILQLFTNKSLTKYK